MFAALIDKLHSLPPTVKGREFEQLVRWYLQHAPEYRLVIRRVYLWHEWPGRWGTDAGIDLVAETASGELWAIQAKAYWPSYSIKKTDVDSFLSESNRREFSFRLLIATTDRLGATAARTIHDQEKPVGIKLLSQLLREDVVWPESLNELRAPELPLLAPLPHQEEAIRDVVAGLQRESRGQLLMACGTGKTLASLWIDEALESRRTLVLSPSLSLLGQTLRVWAAQASEPFQYLAVCSDETVASSTDGGFISWTSDLGVPVTTDADAVAARLSQARGRQVVFSTYQSSPVIADAQEKAGHEFDLAIVDEAHRVAGQKGRMFATVLDGSRVIARRRLFMTATPRFVSSRLRAAADDRDVAVTSMDDPRAFGRVLHTLSFREAIERDLLSDYRVVVIGVDDPGVRDVVARRRLVTVDGQEVTDAETLARQVGLLRAARRFDLRRVLTFHSRIAAAKDFAGGLHSVAEWAPAEVRPAGRLWAQHITGAMTAGEREGLLDQLRTLDGADWAVLSNVRCVAEGVDMPALDGIAFIDPKRSQIEVIQAVGRAIRRSPDKSIGTVVIPVVIPPGASDEDVLETSDFRAVWAAIRALRAHDDVLAEQLDTARFELGRRSRAAELPEKIVLDLPAAVSPDFARAFTARLVERSTSPFEFWLGLLTKYAKEHGTVATLQRLDLVEGHELGAWAMSQRQQYRTRGVPRDRIARLEALPGWAWQKQDQRWEYMYALLKQYAEREGHALVPRTHLEDEERLGAWINNQRRAYRGRRPRDRVPQARVDKFEALPGWSWHADDAKWEAALAALDTFIAREGHVDIPRRHMEGEVRLDTWVDRQRQRYVEGKMEPDRVSRLEAIPGWWWRRRMRDS